MIVIGTFIRGPGWMWFWPGQTWDHNKLIYEVNIDLHEIIGIHAQPWVGLFGAAVVGGYFLIGGLVVHHLFKRYQPKDYQRMSFLQYNTLMMLLLLMISLPIKMLLRLALHIKYVWVTPWFNV
jgi:hypothetical protein